MSAMATFMNVKLSLFSILFFSIFLISVSASSSKCVKTGPCRCEYDNGTAIDLTSLKDNFYSTSFAETSTTGNNTIWRMIFFYFHPCKNDNLPMNDTTNHCKSTSVCKRTVQMTKINETSYSTTPDDDKYVDLGKVEDAQFVTNQVTTSLVYTFQKDLQTIIELVCVVGGTKLTITNSDAKATILTFYSPSVCTSDIGTHHSFGTTLLIIFFVLVLAYLLVGALVKHFLMGAQGLELIPNLNFWRDLPNLVKDGVAFLTNGCKPPPQSATPAGATPNPNSYDSI